MKRFPCRCKACGARQTLARHPLDYVRVRACKYCKGELRVDLYRKTKENKKPCRCFGYPFPHRRGGGKWCEFHPTGPTEQDYVERYGADSI